MARLTKMTLEKKDLFMAALCEGKSIAAAAKIAGISRGMAYVWRSRDPDFAQEWDDAIEVGTDILQDEAREMAKTTPLMNIFLLKARRPEKYKDRVYNEHT